MKLDAAVKARQAAESFSVTTSIGLLRVAGNCIYSNDGVTITKDNAYFAYDSLGRLVVEDNGKDFIRKYDYSGSAITLTLTERPLPAYPSLYYQPFMPGGHMELTGTPGKEVLVKRSNYETMSSMPAYSVDFSLSDEDPEVSFGIRSRDGDCILGKDRIEVIAHSSCIVIQGYKGGSQCVSVPVTDYKLNAQYSARFEVTGQGVNVYVWEKCMERPAEPACILDIPQWSPRFFVSTKKGNAVFDNFTVSYKTSTKQPVSSVVKLWSKVQAENTARSVADAAKIACESALSSETRSRDDFEASMTELNTIFAQESSAASVVAELETVFGLTKHVFTGEAESDTGMGVAGTAIINGAAAFRDSILGSMDFSYIVYNANRSIKEIGLYDGSCTVFDDKGLPVSSNSGGIKSDYSYLFAANGEIERALILRNGQASEFGEDGNLDSVTIQDGTKIEYNGDEISAILTPDGASRLYIGGQLSTFLDKDGAIFTFGPDSRPLTAKDKDGNLYKYEYSIDPADGQEVIVIRDIKHGVLRFYKNDLLFRVEEEGGLVSRNVYSADNQLISVSVEKRGAQIARYDYIYNADGLIEVRDSEGCVRVYAQDGKLKSMTDRAGYAFIYTYSDVDSMRAEFVRPSGWVGALTNYLPEDFVVAQDFVNGRLRLSSRADGTTTLYSDTGKPVKILNGKGEAIVEYQYSLSDELMSVTMSGARKDLTLACETARSGVNAERENLLEQIRFKLENFSVYCMSKYASLMASSDPAIRAKALADYNAALKPVKDEAAAARAQVEIQAAQQISVINAEGERLSVEIAKQEAVPLITYYYRTVFGRDPDKAETGMWLSKIVSGHDEIDKDQVIAFITTSSEYAVRKEEVSRIKSSVRDCLQAYLGLTFEADKEVFLSRLGLSISDTVGMTPSEAEKILKWIDSQGLHFGQSAFLALKNVLSAGGVQTDIEELSINTILIDILTGAMDVSS
ncbi:MAG TPA: hypothetical protein PLV52_03320, partial [Candidatus Omnitrophota bacterium]|nr:hypothetical protein [Candidatus Omnitrophota bacterium]